MAFEQREGQGVLFRSEKKSEKAPDYTGNILIAGNLYNLSAWIKEGKNGKFFSIAAQVKGAFKSPIPQSGQTDAPVKTESKPNVQKFDEKAPFTDLTDDIPFMRHGHGTWRLI